jgi:L-iditol 2-dehydrogenase
LDGAAICAQERTVFGSCSASVDLQEESARLVWDDAFPADELISHRLPLNQMNEGIHMARRPSNGTLKIIVHPQR